MLKSHLQSNPMATATTLSEVETRKLLARLPALKTEASDTLSFKLRESSLLPPRAGETITGSFRSSDDQRPVG